MRRSRTAALALTLIASACSGTSGVPHVAPSTAPLSPDAPTTIPVRPQPPLDTSGLAAVRIGLQRVVSGLSSPVAIVFRPGATGTPGTMYVAEQAGKLRVVTNGHASSAAALDLGGNLTSGNEQGFLGAAFSPDGAHLYVDYTDRNGDTNVDEYAMRGANAEASTRRRVLFVKQPYPNHNGGEVEFGPDAMLYIGLGDGGSAGDPQHHAQNLGTPLGKILRIDPTPTGGATYSVPRDNPFVGRKAAFPEIWMWGLRNPWRFSFDRATGDAWIGDVGQGEYEEVDFAPHGQQGINWGWNRREGKHRFAGAAPAGARDPIIETTHSDGNCAIVGGYVYRGRAIPKLDGVYLYGDDCRPNIEGIVQRHGHAITRRDMKIRVPQLTTFGEDRIGELYVAALETGTVYRIIALAR